MKCNKKVSILCKNHIIPQKRVRNFFCEIFKIDEKEKLNQDEKFKEEVVNMFLDIFLALVLHTNH